MSIEAFCPNGHRILCPDDSVGRAARCPKCATPFRIGVPQAAAVAPPAATPGAPTSETSPAGTDPEAGAETEFSAGNSPATEQVSSAAAAPEATEASAATAAEASGSKLGSESKIASSESKLSTNGAAKPPVPLPPGSIAFLCPNGHKLNGPEKLAGRLGQCPHCNTKFQIPPLDVIRAAQSGQLENLEEVQFPDSDGGSGMASEGIAEVEDSAHVQQNTSELEQMLATLHVDHPTAAARPASGINILGSAINKVAAKLTGGLGSTVGTTTYQIGPSHQIAAPQQHAESSVHALADLMMRLWPEREHGGIIELHLEGGNVLLPDWFDQQLSLKSHGLFAGQAADGTVTMTVVPWDSVERVVIRGVVGLPDGMFE
jgi:hypothetical protein